MPLPQPNPTLPRRILALELTFLAALCGACGDASKEMADSGLGSDAAPSAAASGATTARDASTERNDAETPDAAIDADGPSATRDARADDASAETGAEGGTGAATDASRQDATTADASVPSRDGGSADDRCDVARLDPAHPPKALDLSGNLGTHDPALIEAGGNFYLWHTGARLPGKVSSDLMRWQAAPTAFTKNPDWIAREVPGATDLWAPDVSFFGGQFHLYYSASTFGSNASCIGHATRASLDTGSWSDQGSVVCSNHGSSDDWNAIDPNLVLDERGTPYLVFGSFWSGIKAVELKPDGTRKDAKLYALASRNGGAIEGPFVVRRCGYYYLFVSFDKCCDGANSTYNLRVGRSPSLLGPYVDRQGKALLEGGGTPLLAGEGRYRGPGHNAVVFSGTRAYNVYHAYDANASGAPTLRVAELAWDDAGWPVSGGP